MIFIPRKEYEKLSELNKSIKDQFINNCKNAEPGFCAMIEIMKEAPDFDSRPEHEKVFVNDFLKARIHN